MSVREYIGARYVPVFANPIQWDNTRTYEPLTIVTNQGNSYTSRKYVPTGIALNNDEYWALTGDFNQQTASITIRLDTLENDLADVPNGIVKKTDNGFEKASGSDIAGGIGSNPVQRATGDAQGRNIANTYVTKTEAGNYTDAYINLRSSNIELDSIPQVDTTGNAQVRFQDKNGLSLGALILRYLANGNFETQIYGQTRDSDNNSLFNTLGLGFDADDNPIVYINRPAAWRNAIFGNNGVLQPGNGGTGVTSYSALRNALGLGTGNGALQVDKGGTGVTSYSALRNELGLGSNTGVLGLQYGGSGMSETEELTDINAIFTSVAANVEIEAVKLLRWGKVVTLSVRAHFTNEQVANDTTTHWLATIRQNLAPIGCISTLCKGHLINVYGGYRTFTGDSVSNDWEIRFQNLSPYVLPANEGIAFGFTYVIK